MEIKEPLFVRTSTGWFKLTPSSIGGDDKIGELLAARAAQAFPNAFQLGGQPAHVSLSGPPSSRRALISVCVPKLKVHTFYSVSEGALVPVFRNLPDSVRMDLEWTPPPTMRLWFALDAQMVDGKWRHGTPFVFLKSTNKAHAGTFKVPLPNCYDHGAICLGHVDWKIGDVLTVAQQAYDQLQTATWNTDLLYDHDAPARNGLFRFDLATNKQIPFTAEWERLVKRLSNPTIDTAITQ